MSDADMHMWDYAWEQFNGDAPFGEEVAIEPTVQEACALSTIIGFNLCRDVWRHCNGNSSETHVPLSVSENV